MPLFRTKPLKKLCNFVFSVAKTTMLTLRERERIRNMSLGTKQYGETRRNTEKRQMHETTNQKERHRSAHRPLTCHLPQSLTSSFATRSCECSLIKCTCDPLQKYCVVNERPSPSPPTYIFFLQFDARCPESSLSSSPLKSSFALNQRSLKLSVRVPCRLISMPQLCHRMAESWDLTV